MAPSPDRSPRIPDPTPEEIAEVEAVLERYQTDPAFREQCAKETEEALRRALTPGKPLPPS